MTDTMVFLTGAYNLACNTRTSVVQAYTPEEWLTLYRAYLACGWDFTPDLWTFAQREAAKQCGWIPAWDDKCQPIRPTKKLPGFE